MWQPCGAFRHRRAHTPAIGVREGFTPLQAPKRAITREPATVHPVRPPQRQSGRLDLNQRPLRPERSALPDCATARGGPKGSVAVRAGAALSPRIGLPLPYSGRVSARRLALLLAGALAAVSCGSGAAPRADRGARADRAPRSIRRSAAVAARPVRRADLSDRARGDRRRFVVERDGRILVVRGGRVLRRPFLDITSDVSSGGESGLLSMAFAPDYARSRRFYVYYTDNQGFIRVEQFSRARSTADRAAELARPRHPPAA